MSKRFSRSQLEAFQTTKYLYIRSGNHRFIPIWVVVVQERVIVRSWNDKSDGWYRAFLAEPNGDVRLGQREVPIRAVPVRSSKLKLAADIAYGEKYTTKANAKYVEGFATDARRTTTLELLPG